MRPYDLTRCACAAAIAGVTATWALNVGALARGADDASTGVIVGMLVDSQGQSLRTGRAVVFVCDPETGMPLSAKTKRPIEPRGRELLDVRSFWHAVTEDTGSFRFDGAPAGTYRLVAQSWAGIEGLPRIIPGSGDDAAEPSSIIILHGTAEDVEVKAGETTQAHPRKWGEESLRITTDPEEPHNFVLVSRGPLLGDGVLGPLGWGPEFLAGIVGVTRMEDSHLTLIGLPKGATVHVGLLNYDNRAGVGGGTFVVGAAAPARLPIYATWSNGKSDPPARLEELTRRFESSDATVENVLQLIERNGGDDFYQYVWRHAKDPIEIAGFGQAPLVDVLAAQSYARLRKFHRDRREQQAGGAKAER